jgi:hypothetical protein
VHVRIINRSQNAEAAAASVRHFHIEQFAMPRVWWLLAVCGHEKQASHQLLVHLLHAVIPLQFNKKP